MGIAAPAHSQQVSAHFDRLIGYVPLQPGQQYLDVGCGNGAAPIYLAEKYHLTVTGIDVDAEQIKLAQAQSQALPDARFLTIDGAELPFPDQSFDIVATNKVMHHIPNWPDVLTQMDRVLKPGGYFVYADLVIPDWLAAIGQSIIKYRAGFPTIRAVALFFSENSFEPVHLSTSAMHYEGVFQKI